ncbi:MAG: transglutaminase family protein, partial [Deltaproteobacteria bacterium]|nr:transglutaminase family protein [Deltaproteobacteria bacterium]
TPRVTRPFSDEAWAQIDALGDTVDRELLALDARLTHGGEPTFVSVDHPDAPEWNLEALGADKKERADVLVRRLLARFAPGGLLHLGQGKWYPGEQLPRWAMSIFFRRDGRRLWSDPTLYASENASSGQGPQEAERLIQEIARKLGVNPRYAAPAYEDAFYYLWRERRLPVNVNPLDSKLRDEAERARLARAFEAGLGRVVGYALPLAPEEPGTGIFRSGLFTVRSGRLFLVPGDSPMGYRLPLDSLPWMPDAEQEATPPRDPFAPAPPLPAAPPLRAGHPSDAPVLGTTPGAAPGLVRTALCVEPRGGTLHVFLPPVALLEDFVALVSAIEAAARDLSQPVVIEGYPPPQDQRLERLAVTPDPGVIEVNLHPSSSWRELVTRTEALQEEARASRLSTEKFEIDGRHSGTGGGCHITLGGPTPADSPFLRRPDLLASLVGYFHDHPALSYLFAGLFVGPTSQAPRVDEARHEATYELEIALRRLEAATPASSPPPPWLVDRIFRHVLADQTGNTHRSAICIDKLYSPDGPTGRLGLVELRSFEMPPHPRMSLLTQLLVRSLVATLLREPYRAALPRWGTDLHDRFLLPHFLALDLRDVLGDLGRAGFGFDPSWFDVHHEFRFPRLGAVVVDGVELELRRALEPWHVLAEEPGPGGVSRAVDSSLERVQLRVRGAVPTRHAVLVNGVPAPLHPTGTQEEAVAGVRYRAWALPRSLHPTVRLHSPLVVDLVDRWTGRAIGGCTVHAAHPGGRSYDHRPVNANEAEARRSLLFSPMGHTPGALPAPPSPPTRTPDYPLTLDLRGYPESE